MNGPIDEGRTDQRVSLDNTMQRSDPEIVDDKGPTTTGAWYSPSSLKPCVAAGWTDACEGSPPSDNAAVDVVRPWPVQHPAGQLQGPR